VIDRTHDGSVISWIDSANGHRDFPLQNLPHGIFSDEASSPRGGVAIGDWILDLQAMLDEGLLASSAASLAAAGPKGHLNDFLGLATVHRKRLRAELFKLLAAHTREGVRARALMDRILVPADRCRLHLPARIGDYTDFYAGIHHATNAGGFFRPDMPLLPNYKHVPIGYHGRASSVQVSGTPVRRPCGQIRRPDAEVPEFAASGTLDFELELGVWIGAGNPLGEPIPIHEAADHIGGFCLLNDWSARDIQAWEYQPLGPFLAKSFLTSISPWIITPEALMPFRAAAMMRPADDPQPLPYLCDAADQHSGSLDCHLEVALQSRLMRTEGVAPTILSRTNAGHLYWTFAQMVTHHASAGCNLRPGDLIGSGTISGSSADSAGSMLELTDGGRTALALPGGEQRLYLQDGDQITMTARCSRPGFASIGLGKCVGEIVG
jgi:fumarylacetoacetase